MLGLIVSGRPPQTFLPVEGIPNRFLSAIPEADNINHIVVFITEPLPEGYGAAVYFAWPSSEGGAPQWTYLGYLSNLKPSAIYKIVKPKDPSLYAADARQSSLVTFNTMKQHHEAGVGISIEPLETLQMQQAPVAEASQKSTLEQFCTKMLENFVNYASSFAISNPANPSETYVPIRTVSTWFENFQRKLNADPHFWKS